MKVRAIAAIVAGFTLFGCGPTEQKVTLVFPNGFGGPFYIFRDEFGAPCKWRDGRMYVYVGSDGKAQIKPSDFERLFGLIDEHYQYANGTRIPGDHENIPGTYAKTFGYRSTQKATHVGGRDVTVEQEWLEGSVGSR